MKVNQQIIERYTAVFGQNINLVEGCFNKQLTEVVTAAKGIEPNQQMIDLMFIFFCMGLTEAMWPESEFNKGYKQNGR